MARIIVITSGKGGVGKTTSSASIGIGLALKGHKVALIDFDIGLRNLDLIMGCERRVVYDFVNVINGETTLNQALIKDKRASSLSILPASQTRDKDALTKENVGKVLEELAKTFDYIICDSPAGIEAGAMMALYYADEAIEHLLLTRYSPKRVEEGEMLSVEDVVDILSIPLLGVIPESQAVLKASNAGEPVILDTESDAGQAYQDVIDRLLGETVEFRFLVADKKGIFTRMFGGG
jgi:septum site-determining protein MinD